ncbi:MAG: carboxypeptidase regulatory-like domain-containing protein [Kofleriaceae bacterium]
MRIAAVLGVVGIVVMLMWRGHHGGSAVATSESAPPIVVHPKSLAFKAGGSIAGTVRDEKGHPIAAAHVCASGYSEHIGGDRSRDPRCAITNPAGQYEVTNLFVASFRITATAATYAAEIYTPNGADSPVGVMLAADEHKAGIDFVLHAGVEVSGTISDVEGGPIPHAHVRAGVRSGRYGFGETMIEADNLGRYSLWLRPGVVSLTAFADGYAERNRSGNAPGMYDFMLVAESTLSGTVVDAMSGAPVPGIVVYANGAGVGPASVESTTTDEQGHYTVTRLLPGRYAVVARGAHGFGRADASVALSLGEHGDNITVKLWPAHQVTGRVIANGSTCLGAMVYLDDEEQDIAAGVVADPDGVVRLDGVLPGHYVVGASCDGHLSRPHYDPIVVTDHDIEATWTVDTGVSLSGTVRTASGQVVSDVDVTVQGEGSYGSDHVSRTGAFELHGLKPGHLTVQVSRYTNTNGGHIPLELELDVPFDTHRALVIPDATGSIVGRALHAEGTVHVQARTEDNYQIVTDTDDVGHFEIHHLQPGSYELVVASNTDRAQDPISKPVTVVVGTGETTIDLDVHPQTGVIRGRVVDSNGQPIDDAFIGVARESDESANQTDARRDDQEILAGTDGHFTIKGLGTSRYTVRAMQKDGGEAFAEHVAVGADVTLTIQAPGSIAGLVQNASDELQIKVFADHQQPIREETFFHTDGKFTIDKLAPGSYRLVITSGGADRSGLVIVAAGSETHVDFTLDRPVTIVGHAIDQRTKQPVAGIMMFAQRSMVSMAQRVPSDQRNLSDATGRFEIPYVPHGEVEIFGRSLVEGKVVRSPINVMRTVNDDDGPVIDIGDVYITTETNGLPYGDLGFAITAGGTIGELVEGGPADTAGIVAGDVITEVDGIPIAGQDVNRLIGGDPGASHEVTLERGVTVTLTLGQPHM